VLSVIVPTHNRMLELERALAGLEGQTYRDFEVVVAVDGSTDGTTALLVAIGKRQPYPLTVLLLAQGGQALARNKAIRAATGETLVLCDDDLVLAPETLARHAAFHQLYPRSVAIGPVTYREGGLQFPTRPGWVNLTGMNASLPRREALAVGLFDESLAGYGGEDLEFGFRLAGAGLKFRPLPDADSLHLAPMVRNVAKARSAGYQAYKIAAKHGARVGFQLGVHPTLMAVKGAYLNRALDQLVANNPNYAFERAYQQGALEAKRELEREPEPVINEEN